MKKIVFLLLVAISISFNGLYGQIADGITYQAVALDEKGKDIPGRDLNGNIIHSRQIKVRFSILNRTSDGDILYMEEHATYTDPNGLFSLVIGHGEVSSEGLHQKLLDINWGAEKLFLSVEIDIKSKGEYKLMGVQQMMAVPFALHSLTSSSSKVNYADIIAKPTLSTVATSGNYNDLSGKPPAFSGSFNDLTNKPVLFDGSWTNITGKPTTLAGYGITNGMSTSHSANVITSAMITNWNTAFAWGNPAGLYKPYSYVPTWVEITGKPTFAAVSTSGNYNDLTNKPTIFDGSWVNVSGKPSTLAGYGITDAVSSSSPANSITNTNISNWNTAFSWGSHAGLYRPITYVPAWTEITSNPFLFTSPANNQLIRYVSVSGRWENWTPNYLIAEVDGSITNEVQSLSIVADKLSISGGNTVTLPTAGPTGPIGPAGFGGANLTFPDGFNNMVAVNNYSGGIYAVPAGKNLYITSLVEKNVFFEDNNNTRVGEFYRTREGAFQAPLIVKENWHFTGRFSGFLVDAVVVPIYFAVSATNTYTVPINKTLFIMYSYRIFHLRVQNQPVYSTSGGEVNDELFIPIIVTQGQIVSSSSLDCYVFGYLK